jgi:ligand-binding SRPBCC domain-containing protein
MPDHILERRVWLPRPRPEVFEFFADAANLSLIQPPWARPRWLAPPPRLAAGAVLDFRVPGLPIAWRVMIREFDPPYRFVDVQLRGPFARWEHRHRFLEGPAYEPGGTPGIRVEGAGNEPGGTPGIRVEGAGNEPGGTPGIRVEGAGNEPGGTPGIRVEGAGNEPGGTPGIRVEAAGNDSGGTPGTWVEDRVTYRFPAGALGRLAHALGGGRWLRGLFDYRDQRLRERFGGG